MVDCLILIGLLLENNKNEINNIQLTCHIATMPSRFLPTHKSRTHGKAGRHGACGFSLSATKNDINNN